MDYLARPWGALWATQCPSTSWPRSSSRPCFPRTCLHTVSGNFLKTCQWNECQAPRLIRLDSRLFRLVILDLDRFSGFDENKQHACHSTGRSADALPGSPGPAGHPFRFLQDGRLGRLLDGIKSAGRPAGCQYSTRTSTVPVPASTSQSASPTSSNRNLTITPPLPKLNSKLKRKLYLQEYYQRNIY